VIGHLAQPHAGLCCLVCVCWCVAADAQTPSGESSRPATELAASAASSGAVQLVETIFAQSPIEATDVDRRIIGDVRPPQEFFCVRVANLGPGADETALAWDVGRHTGFRPGTQDTISQFQRGPRQPGEGTAVQFADNTIGIWIDSDAPRPEKGALIPVCPAYWWLDETRAPQPFQQPDRQLSFAFDMQVPTAEREGEAEVYVCAYFLLRDGRSRQAFWLGASLFDLRSAARFRDLVHFDGWEAGTGLPILFTALGEHSAWMHPGPESAHYADRPFAQFQHFEFRVGAAELSAAIRAMKDRWPKFAQVSEDARDYRLIHFNINPEVYAPSGSRGQIGLALRNVRVTLWAPAGE